MRLSHVTLPVAEIPRSRQFYLALGFELVVDEAHYCRFLTRRDEGYGDETLSIEVTSSKVHAGAQLGLEFPSAQALDCYVQDLLVRGLAVHEGPIDRTWLWRDARIFDPDRHEWMLFYAGSNKLDPPWRVPRSLS